MNVSLGFRSRLHKANHRGGFTLIELLVVMAIIGVLTSVVLATVSAARARANDAQRVADMSRFKTALELYYDAYTHYPIVSNWASFDSPAYYPQAVTNPYAVNLTAAMQPFMTITKDPKNLGSDSGYLYIGDGTQYCILTYRTPENMKNYNPSMVNYAQGRCGAIGSTGQCSGTNSVYIGTGVYANGC